MPRVLTIGYGREDFASLEARLSRHGVDVLVDVRSVPYSGYQPDFRYGTIEALCLQSGLRYEFLGDKLGGVPEDPDLLTEGGADYAKIAASAAFAEGTAVLARLSDDHTVCLMCGCERPMRCHRGRLLAPELLAAGFEIGHIDMSGAMLNHDEAVKAETGGQMDLFGD